MRVHGDATARLGDVAGLKVQHIYVGDAAGAINDAIGFERLLASAMSTNSAREYEAFGHGG